MNEGVVRSCLVAALLLGVAAGLGGLIGQPRSLPSRSQAVAGLQVRAENPPPPTFFIKRNLFNFALLLAGTVTLGLSAIFVLAMTGFSIGASVATALSIGLPIDVLWATLFAHGLLELPALLWAGGVGLLGSRSNATHLIRGSGAFSWPRRAFTTAAACGTVLIIGAGLVEAYVSPALLLAALQRIP